MAKDQESTTTSGTTGQAPAAPAGQAPTQPTQPSSDPSGQAPGTAAKPDEATLPDELRGYIESLRAENAAHRKAKKQAEDAAAEAAARAKQAEDTALAEQQRWQELAERRQQEIAALQPQAALAGQLTEWIAGYINAAIQTWPEEVKGMAPNGETSPMAMLEWLEKARPLAERLSQPAPVAPGNGARPRPAGIGQAQAAQLREQAIMAVRGQF